MTPIQTLTIGHKSTYIYVNPRNPSPKFSSVSLYVQPFSKYSTCQDFPIDSHVKISNCHKMFKTWPISKKVTSCNSHHGSQCPNTVWLTSDKNYWRNTILKFPVPYGPVLAKNFKVPYIQYLADRQKKSNSLCFPITNIFIIKFNSNWTETVGEVAFLKFWLPQGSMLKKTKKKIVKI